MNTKKLIETAFDALECLDNRGWTSHRENLFALCKDEERGHRSFGTDFAKYHPGAPSVAFIGKMFAVKRIAEYLGGQKFPRGADYLHYQKSAFYAAGLADEFRADIEKAWVEFDIKALAALNYTDFVKVQTPSAK